MLPLFIRPITGSAAYAALGTLSRNFSTSYANASSSELKATLAEMIPSEQARLKAIKKMHGTKPLGTTSVDMCIGGMRGIPGILWETSLLDAEEGIRFRGHSIPDLQTILEAMPEGSHPMAQFSMLVLALQKESKFAKAYADGLHKSKYWEPKESKFAKAYADGLHKSKYWEPVYEDSMDLIAKLPEIAALIYRKNFKGYDSEEVYELMRMYQTIHSDHEPKEIEGPVDDSMSQVSQKRVSVHRYMGQYMRLSSDTSLSYPAHSQKEG
eukprot:gene5115-34918_t